MHKRAKRFQSKNVKRPGRNLNPSPELDRLSDKEKIVVNESTLHTYLSLCEIEGLCGEWLATITRFLRNYLKHIDWTITQKNTIIYLKKILRASSISYYRKQAYQIRKFLTYLKIDWADAIRLPAEVEQRPKHLCKDDIDNTLRFFSKHPYNKQIKAIILLGATSGMRAEELYQLRLRDIDVENRIVRINHDPSNGQTTKTKKCRISFINEDAKNAILDYIDYFENSNNLKSLFSKSHIKNLFKDGPIKVKDLRKYFSQEWDRRGGPTSIKKILMGHSLRNDVDLMHYNAQSEEDLKKIYDKVMF